MMSQMPSSRCGRRSGERGSASYCLTPQSTRLMFDALRRDNELFFMIDTCQANTMYSKIYSPNVLATGSSKKDQNSYSHNTDFDLGIAMIDRFTNHVLEYMEHVNKTSEKTMQDLFDGYDVAAIHSDPGVRTDLYPRDPTQVRITDFFGGVSQVELT